MGERPGPGRRKGPRGTALCAITALALAGGLWAAAPTLAQAAAGREGPPFDLANGVPTARPEESKLWWHDGHWWGSLWSDRARDFHIFRLAGGRWHDTGVTLDTRERTRADVLVAADRLYVVSHRFNRRPAKDGSLLFRYTYDAGSRRYEPDRRFPVAVNRYGSETLVLAREAGGRLWVTWTQGRRVWLRHARCTPDCNDRVWAEPSPIDGPEARVAPDDVSSIVSLPGDRVAVMWSNQRLGAFYYLELGRGAQPERIAIVEGADDHLNLKSDSQGRIYAAVKTTSNQPGDLLTGLLVRDPRSGEWQVNLFGRAYDGHTRPIVVVDEAAGVAHVYAMAAAPEGGPAQAVYRKTTNLEATEPFPLGPGEVVVVVPDGSVRDPTSTKQTVKGWWGLPVLASETRENRYAFGLQAPGGVLSAADGVTSTTAEAVAAPEAPPVDESAGWLLPVVLAVAGLAALTFGAIVVRRR